MSWNRETCQGDQCQTKDDTSSNAAIKQNSSYSTLNENPEHNLYTHHNTDGCKYLEAQQQQQQQQQNSNRNHKNQIEEDNNKHKLETTMCPPVHGNTDASIVQHIPLFISPSNKSFLSDDSNADDGNDNDSVSSLESNSEEFNGPAACTNGAKPQRTIFGAYWQTNTIHEEEGSRSSTVAKSLHTEQTSSFITVSSSTSRCSQEGIYDLPDEFTYQEFNRFKNKDIDICDQYEAILQQKEVDRPAFKATTAVLKDGAKKPDSDLAFLRSNQVTMNRRHMRSLFHNKYSTSSPALSYGYKDMMNSPVHKASSTSSFARKKTQRSCLRSPSQSVDPSASISSSKLSVSFDSKVCIHEYEKRHEKYTSNGWSKWFA